MYICRHATIGPVREGWEHNFDNIYNNLIHAPGIQAKNQVKHAIGVNTYISVKLQCKCVWQLIEIDIYSEQWFGT